MEYIATPSAEHLDLDALRLTPHPQNETRHFPDGEVYVQLDAVASVDDAVVVHAGQPHPNRGLAYLNGLLALLSEHGCSSTLVVTYAPYNRQDAAFYEGGLNYVRSLLQTATDCYKVEHIFAVDPHFGHRDWVDAFPVTCLHAFPRIQDRVDMDDYVVVGPDLGAVERFGIPGYEKARESAYSVELTGEFDVDGRNVLVFDDLIATGGTMVEAFERLKAQGADTVQAAAVHGVLDEGVQRVWNAYDTLYLTNTIANEVANVRIEPVIEDAVGEPPETWEDDAG